MTDRTKNTVLQEIAWIFEANTADDNTWDACEITERIADILKDEGHFRECDDHGVFPSLLATCPRCETDDEEDDD